MPPKKKGNKKAQDDWEADLGESITPSDAPAEAPKADEPAAEEDAGFGGGLMASLQRRNKKKGTKGADQDFVQGEEPTTDGAASPALEDKAPEEANLDDDDVFAGNFGKKDKTKGGANKKEEAKEDKGADGDDGPRVKTKAEKEKEKKEKEKQRKKEMVRFTPYLICELAYNTLDNEKLTYLLL